MNKIKRALVSVSDKKGIVELGKALAERGVEILSTGGTAKALQAAGVPVTKVSDFTGSPEVFEGRVKTLHPKIHGGLLFIRNSEEHVKQAEENDIKPIDMVVVNLYPFEATIAKEGATLAEAIENIDIGGPSMLRSAAKNNQSVAVITNPDTYEAIIKEMDENNGALTDKTRLNLAVEAFAHTANYDAVISSYLAKQINPEEELPRRLFWGMEKKQSLRYGENPHQKAAFYKLAAYPGASLADAIQHSGKELSFNNIYDLDAALTIVRDFTEPTVAVIKHTNPCGLASAATLLKAYQDAHECDPLSAFGSIIGLNRKVDLATAEAINQQKFVEAVIAPGYEAQALELLCQKQNRRIMEFPKMLKKTDGSFNAKVVTGGLLLQDMDLLPVEAYNLQVVSDLKPSEEQMKSLIFAFRAAKHVKSNAIVLVQGTATVGIGAGQMSRVDSSIIAARKAGEKAKGAVLGSDAFFPFRDGVDAAAEAGVTAIIQPGGSKGDEEVIKAANEHKMIMVFTGYRHFKH